MTKVMLGKKPAYAELPLVKNSDYEAVITYEVGGVVTNWPASTAISLVFANGVTWTATVSGSDATFDVDKAVVNAMPARVGVSLVYTNSTRDRVLLMGMAQLLEMTTSG